MKTKCVKSISIFGMITLLMWLSVYFESRRIMYIYDYTMSAYFKLSRYDTSIPYLVAKQKNGIQYNKSLEDCVAKQQIVFLKTHKTGSTTLARIIEQYAVDHRLQIVRRTREEGSIHFAETFNYSCPMLFLPPMGVQPGDYSNYKYDVFSLHGRYNRSVYDSFMNGRPFYLTILRNPVTQFESAFDFFSLGSVVNSSRSREERLSKFMKDIDYYWNKVKKTKQRYGHNSLLWDLGVDDPSGCSNSNCLDHLFRRLDDEIDLVLINDLYDESLLIMKKMLCWEFEDILYIPRNRRKHRTSLSNDVAEKIMDWNSADFALYGYFVKRIKQRILEYGPNFKSELAAFRDMLTFVHGVCISNEVINHKYKNLIEYNRTENISSSRCKRNKSTDICRFNNGYQLRLNLSRVCQQTTSEAAELNIIIRKMMKGDDDEIGSGSVM